MEQIEFNTVVGFKLRQIRTRKRISQDAICEEIEISQSAYSHREMGRHPFTAWELHTLAEFLEVGLYELLPFDINMGAD